MLDDFTNRNDSSYLNFRKKVKMTFNKYSICSIWRKRYPPWEKLDYEDVNVKKKLSERVVGQDEAIEKIENNC